MGKFYNSIPDFLIPWIEKQKIFWVATAPLTGDGLINVSPKGMMGSFHIIDANKASKQSLMYAKMDESQSSSTHSKDHPASVAFLEKVSSASPVSMKFTYLPSPPPHYQATIYKFGMPEYDCLLPLKTRKIGSRSVIMVDIIKVGTSCSYAVPFMEYKGKHSCLLLDLSQKEMADIAAEKTLDLSSPSCKLPLSETGLKRYWSFCNAVSLCGLPKMLVGQHSHKTFVTQEPTQASRTKHREDAEIGKVVLRVSMGELKLVAAFLTDANEVLDGIQKVKEVDSSVDLEMVWGHKGIRGNEHADQEAKRAAEGKETELCGLRFLQKTLWKSKAAIMMRHKKLWQAAAEDQIRQSPRFKRAKLIDPNMPKNKVILATLAALP
ncbi:hypothetical protein C0995_014658 [Termitomyces sp. Mi166|nr:hypothetical protein C0995_014658 [Termitomyces sp. Mi166\